jgi:hypothetical protein
MNAVPIRSLTDRIRIRILLLAATAAVVFAIGGCGDDDDDGGDGPFELIVHPEFVQGMYADLPVTVLVTIEDTDSGTGEVSLTADFSHGAATVSPSQISTGQIAEVTITAEPVVDEMEATLTVTATRGDVEHVGERQIFVMPGEDDRESTARDLLAVFTAWLEENHPDLGITPDSSFESSLVAPRLLVVSHYMFDNDEYELGVSWHIMIPPDDWSELYIRPKDSLTPAQAFRVSSWSAALAGDDVAFTEVAAPPEIVR